MKIRKKHLLICDHLCLVEFLRRIQGLAGRQAEEPVGVPLKRGQIIKLRWGDLLRFALDIFHKDFEGLIIAEVEFPDETSANSYIPPEWFSRDVTTEGTFHNSTLSNMSADEITALLEAVQS